MLALAYLLTIVYASLQPFSGWRMPPADILAFLTAPLPRYVTFGDLALNFAAYVPFGVFLLLALRARRRAAVAVVAATALAGTVSLAMECVQMFMPTRIASNLDFLTNTAGAFAGALAAAASGPLAVGATLARARRDWFVTGGVADAGLVIIGLWLAAQLHPAAQLFGTGDLRAVFELPRIAIHTPHLFATAEAAVVALNILGVGLVLCALARRQARPLAMSTGVIAAALAVRSISGVALFSAPGLLHWLTPGAALGIAGGGLALYLLHRLPRWATFAAAAASIGAALAVINLAPSNPYQQVPPYLIAGGQSHLLSFSHITRVLAEYWPFVAAVYAIIAAGARMEDRS